MSTAVADYVRTVRRHDGCTVGTISRLTGEARAKYSYRPVEELPAVIYGVDNQWGDSSWFATYSDARAALIDWSYAYIR